MHAMRDTQTAMVDQLLLLQTNRDSWPHDSTQKLHIRTYQPYHPVRPPSPSYPHVEPTYRGPIPTIPNFSSEDPREFARLKIALENLLPVEATERFKYQILDHLKQENALLIADSYVNSRYPYTNTMRSLTALYGQPHQLALQRIAELMDGPKIIECLSSKCAH